jgi:hypothetical protein
MVGARMSVAVSHHLGANAISVDWWMQKKAVRAVGRPHVGQVTQ